MKKEQIIGIVLIAVVIFIYMAVIMPKYYTPPAGQKPGTGTLAKNTTAPGSADTTGLSVGKDTTLPLAATSGDDTTTPVLAAAPAVPAQDILVDTDLYRARFTTLGGRLKSFLLKKVKAETLPTGKELEDELKAARESGNDIKIESATIRLELVRKLELLKLKLKDAQAKKDSAAVAKYTDEINELNWVELIHGNSQLPMPFQVELAGIPKADTQVIYSANTTEIRLSGTTPTAKLLLTGIMPNGLTIQKEITLQNNNYMMGFDLQLANPGDKLASLRSLDGYGMKLYAGSGLGDMQMHAQSRYDIGVQPVRKVDNKVKIMSLSLKKPDLRVNGNVSWAGLETNYFFKGYVSTLSPSTSVVANYTPIGHNYSPTLWLEMPPAEIPAKDTLKQSYQFYLGPKDADKLAALNVKVEEILFPGWLQTINLWLLKVTKLCYKLTHNYGLAIILIAFLLKLVTFPLNHMSYKSMKGMQLLAPEMKAIQEKFKDDPQRQQKEMMELYRKYKVNPMSGCLPMLIQMPIFISLYQVLGKVIELRGAHFFGWITDLSKPDTITMIMGLPINILPILMGVTMWLQQKMTTSPDPKSARMGQIMTVVFLFIFWSMPSGLVLYWFVTNILSILQQHYINKQDFPVHLHHAEAK